MTRFSLAAMAMAMFSRASADAGHNLTSEDGSGLQCNVRMLTLMDQYGIQCAQVNVGCQWVPVLQLLGPFQVGKCTGAGYGVQTHSWGAWTIPKIGSVTLSFFADQEPPSEPCSVHYDAVGICMELSSTCDLMTALKKQFGMTDGGCPAESWTYIEGTTGPVFPDINFSAYIDNSMDPPTMSGETCNVYMEGGDAYGAPCVEIAMDCTIVPNLHSLFVDSLMDGMCADAGYSVELDSPFAQSFWVPLGGDIVTKVFDKAVASVV